MAKKTLRVTVEYKVDKIKVIQYLKIRYQVLD